MANPRKRQVKIARALIRLKHSLAADEEIEAYIEEAKQNLIEGKDTEIEVTLKEITGAN